METFELQENEYQMIIMAYRAEKAKAEQDRKEATREFNLVKAKADRLESKEG